MTKAKPKTPDAANAATKALKKPRATREPILIGWREHVALPDLALHDLPAKIDTGARTSALHASHVKTYTQDGLTWVQFRVMTDEGSQFRRAPVEDIRDIKNTSGVPETRIVIQTTLKIANRVWKIDVSLADRSNMAFALILGRTAIRRHGIYVDCGKSFLLPKQAKPPVLNPNYSL